MAGSSNTVEEQMTPREHPTRGADAPTYDLPRGGVGLERRRNEKRSVEAYNTLEHVVACFTNVESTMPETTFQLFALPTSSY